MEKLVVECRNRKPHSGPEELICADDNNGSVCKSTIIANGKKQKKKESKGAEKFRKMFSHR